MLVSFLLVGLTQAMETPVPGEMPAPDGVDLARVGLDAPSKAPLDFGAGPSVGAAAAAGGSSYALEFFVLFLTLFLVFDF